MSDPYLLLWLEAPLQSWGHDSGFGRRDSLNFPTKSGVIGLVACALGLGGPQKEWLSLWHHSDMECISFERNPEDGTQAVNEPLLCDFHMVGSGYNSKDPWESLLIPKTSEGKKARGGGTKITHRYYLQGAAFAVALQCPAGESASIIGALQRPVWDLYLGRKSCVPTDFIFRGQFEDSYSALAEGRRIAEEKKKYEMFRVRQGEYDGEVLTLNDVPVELGQHKRYRDRRVTVILPDV